MAAIFGPGRPDVAAIFGPRTEFCCQIWSHSAIFGPTAWDQNWQHNSVLGPKLIWQQYFVLGPNMVAIFCKKIDVSEQILL